MELKTLHITNEISEKNFSISSILSLIDLSDKKFSNEILCSQIDKKSLTHLKFKNLNFLKVNWFSFFKLIKIINLYKKEGYIFHIHGIWSPIQLISLLIISYLNYPLVVHSHGMFLSEAICENGFFKKIFKKLIIFLMKIFFYNKNIFFVSITKQEYLIIKKFFYSNKHFIINNPIPFKEYNNNLNYPKNIKYKKNFVFFGRLHPHKNIILIIKSFLNAKIDNRFKLLIYGIHDDKNYFNKILNLIKNNKNISLKKPIFGKIKKKIINQFWANLLFSKSEVLSFSILKSGLNGIPSIIGKNIETVNNDNVSIKSLSDKYHITKKIEETALWSNEFRKKIGERASNFFKIYKEKSNLFFFQKLFFIYKSLLNTKSYYPEKRKKFSYIFIFSTLSYFFNAFFHSFVLFLIFLFYDLKFVSEIGLVNIVTLLFTLSLSKNARAIINQSNDENLIYKYIYERTLFSILFLFLFYNLNYYYFKFTHASLIFFVSMTILACWIFELVILLFEIKNKLLSLFGTFVFFCFFYLLFFLSFITKMQAYSIFVLILFIFIVFYISIKNLKKFRASSIVDFKNSVDYPFISSILSTFSSVVWRVVIYFSFSKEISGLFFIAFAIGSMPGTLFNNILGPSYIFNKIKINNILNNIFYIFFIFLIILYIYINFVNLNFSNNQFIFLNVACISLIGSFFMTTSLKIRHQNLFKKRNQIKVFKSDIIINILITFVVPVLVLFSNSYHALQYSYLIASLISFLLYRYYLQYLLKKNV